MEIEVVLNSRLLTYVYEDFQSGFTLTPVHFLETNRKLGLPATEDNYYQDKDYQPKRDTATQLLGTWKKDQKYLLEGLEGEVFIKSLQKLKAFNFKKTQNQ